MAVRKKTIAKSASIEKVLDTSVNKLVDAFEDANKAIKLRSAESKKILASSRRLKKRRLTLLNKKKRAIAAEKRNSTVETRKAVRMLTTELAGAGKELVKATAARQVVLAELSGLKASQKKLRSYVRCINAANKQIEKSMK